MSSKLSENLFISLTEVHDEFVDEAQMAMKSKKKKHFLMRIKVIPLVACLLSFFVVTSVLALTDWGTYIIDIFSSRTEEGSDFSESGYDLGVYVEKVSVDKLSEDIQNVSEAIIHQYETYKPYNSWYPGHWQESFMSLEDAYEFIGYEDLYKVKLGAIEEQVKLNVHGNEKGDIQSISLNASYRIDEVRIQSSLYITTENDTEPITYGTRTTEDVEFTEKLYETKHHLTCHIISSSPLESGYMSYDGFLVRKGILYNLHVIYKETDEKQAYKLLLNWADSFE